MESILRPLRGASAFSIISDLDRLNASCPRPYKINFGAIGPRRISFGREPMARTSPTGRARKAAGRNSQSVDFDGPSTAYTSNRIYTSRTRRWALEPS
jgi:hypothetical protein